MRRLFLLAPATLLFSALPAQDEAQDRYQKLVATYEKETAEYRNGLVVDLLPDDMPIHAEFLEAAARYASTDDALPFLGWILQNAPRNDQAHAAAVAAVDKHAVVAVDGLRRSGTANAAAKTLLTEQTKIVRTLKYGTVTDAVFAETLSNLKVVAELGDRDTLELAEKMIFKLERLQLGARVPEIAAADLDGVDFKLSDYRGKVVVIDFWGDW